MKLLKILPLVLLLSVSGGLSAQSWFPPGATWYYGYGGYMITGGYVHIKLAGDTVLNGQPANILETTIHYIQPFFGQDSITYDDYVYADADRVYWYHHGMFNLLYDFSAEVGDTLEIYSSKYDTTFGDCDSAVVVVDSTGTMEINGVSHRWYTTTPTTTSQWYFQGRIIEGIGSIGGLNTGGFFPSYWGGEGCTSIDGGEPDALRCYLADSVPVFHGPAYGIACDYLSTSISDNYQDAEIILLPNPANSTIKLQLPENSIIIKKLTLYSILGRKVLEFDHLSAGEEIDISSLPPGTYVCAAQTGSGDKFRTKLVINR